MKVLSRLQTFIDRHIISCFQPSNSPSPQNHTASTRPQTHPASPQIYVQNQKPSQQQQQYVSGRPPSSTHSSTSSTSTKQHARRHPDNGTHSRSHSQQNVYQSAQCSPERQNTRAGSAVSGQLSVDAGQRISVAQSTHSQGMEEA